MENKTIIGILAIVFGILLLIFPFISQVVLSVMVGIGILVLGVYFLIAGIDVWKNSKAASIIYIIVGFLGFIVGIMLFGNVILFDLLISLCLYIAGFMLIFAGIAGLMSRTAMLTRSAAVLMFILGIITIVLGYFAMLSPLYVAIILGISLIIDGIAIAMGSYDEIID